MSAGAHDGHRHGHGHAHGAPAHGLAGARAHGRRRLALTLALTLGYAVAEVVGGLASGSLALLADAGHMVSDAASLALALFASWVAVRPPTRRRTYGFYRAEILAALANGAILVALCAFIVVEAIQRLRDPSPVHAPVMVAVAAGGLVLNLACLRLLHPSRHGSLNVHGAWLHVASDALGSVGVIVSGVLAWTLGWTWADPAASLLVSGLVVWSAWALLREAVAVLMESAPGHIDVDEVLGALGGVEGVVEVHDLHVWTITSGLESLSGHVVAAPGRSRDALLVELRELLERRFGIVHVTLQIETQDCGVPHRH